MAISLSATSRAISPMQWFIVLSVFAVLLALGLPPDPHTLTSLHISALTYRLAVAFLLVPYIVIWYTAFYAFAKLLEYQRYVRKTAEGEAFHKVTIGMGVLAFGLVVPTLVSLILNAIIQAHPGFKIAGGFITSYLTLLVPVVAFTFMNTASRLLVGATREQSRMFVIRLFVIFFLVLSVVYTYLVLRDRSLHPSSYHLNLVLLLLTNIVPYLYAWFLALFSAFEFRLYARRVKGIIYRRALRQFAGGIAVVIGGSIAIQFVDSTVAASVSRRLGSLLIAEYALLVIVAVGLSIMAAGTKKLKKIEDV